MRVALFVIWGTGCTDVGSVTEPPRNKASPDPVLPDDTSPPVDSGPGCAFVIASSDPSNLEADVFYRDDVVMQLAEAPSAATITIADRDGSLVKGTTAVDGPVVTWTGQPRQPNTFYVASLDIEGCETQSIEFLTSATGLPAGNVTDRVFAVDLRSGTWAQPTNIGVLVGKILPVDFVWLSPVALNDEVTLTLAFVAPNGVQAPCLPTVPFAPAPYEDPFFSGQTEALRFDAKGAEVDLRDVTISGAFEPNGGGIDQLTLSGTIDTRPLEDLLDGQLDLCAFAATLDAPCEACPDGEVRCIEVLVENLDATLTGETLVERTEEDIAADPFCDAIVP